MDSIEILRKLVSFPTVSRDSNLDLIRYISELLDAHGVACQLIQDDKQPDDPGSIVNCSRRAAAEIVARKSAEASLGI